MARDFRAPDEPSVGTPPTNFLIIALPRDASDLFPRSYTIETILDLVDDIEESQLTSDVRTLLGQGIAPWEEDLSVNAGKVVSDDDRLWIAVSSDDGSGDSPSEGNTNFELATGTQVSVQYAETNSTTESDWHDTRTNGDEWVRIGIGDPPTYIPLVQSDAESVTFQYAETNSDTDSDWHDTQTDNDEWIRIGIGDPATYTTGIPIAQVEAAVTNLSSTRTENTVTIVSSNGTNAQIQSASESAAGLATTEQITKLNAVEAEATQTVFEYAITDSDDDDDWHDEQADDDDWIRAVVNGTPTAPVPLVQGEGGGSGGETGTALEEIDTVDFAITSSPVDNRRNVE